MRACVCILVRYRKDASVLFLWYVSRGEASTFSIVDVQSSASKWTIVFSDEGYQPLRLVTNSPRLAVRERYLHGCQLHFRAVVSSFFFVLKAAGELVLTRKRNGFLGKHLSFVARWLVGCCISALNVEMASWFKRGFGVSAASCAGVVVG